MSSQPVKIVVGFHDCTPKPPKIAVSHGLTCRVAFVLESYKEGSEDMFFDAELFFKLAKSVSGAVPQDHTEVMLKVHSNFVSEWLFGEKLKNHGLIDILPDLFKKVDAPPSQIHWLKGKVPSAVGVSERWYLAGGPQPYHDSYTFSVFVAEADKNRVAEALLGAAKSVGSNVELINAGGK